MRGKLLLHPPLYHAVSRLLSDSGAAFRYLTFRRLDVVAYAVNLNLPSLNSSPFSLLSSLLYLSLVLSLSSFISFLPSVVIRLAIIPSLLYLPVFYPCGLTLVPRT